MRSGYAFRAGLRVNDRIVRINHTFAGTLTLREAQILIRRSGKRLKIYVQGYGTNSIGQLIQCVNSVCAIFSNRNDDPYTEDEFTVDFWFKPRKINSYLFQSSVNPNHYTIISSAGPRG